MSLYRPPASERAQLDAFVIATGDASPRDQRDLMERPFFSLAKAKRIVPIRYASGDVRVEVFAVPEDDTIHEHFPFIDPGELMPPPLLVVTDGGADRGRLQPVERSLEQFVGANACAAAGCGEKLVGCETQEAGRDEPVVLGFDDLARGPDENIGVPDGRHAVLLPNIAAPIEQVPA